MTNLQVELQVLKDNLQDMIVMVKGQLMRCHKAIDKNEPEAVSDARSAEKKVNAQELAIDEDCENIIALYAPVATDLRFVLAANRISNDLERIADSAHSLAKFLSNNLNKSCLTLLVKFRISEMLDTCIGMLDDMGKALQADDPVLARKTFDSDKKLNEINKQAVKTAVALLKGNHKQPKLILRIFAMVRNLERSGDLTKNIGEEIVFHVEARVLKHRRKEQEK